MDTIIPWGESMMYDAGRQMHANVENSVTKTRSTQLKLCIKRENMSVKNSPNNFIVKNLVFLQCSHTLYIARLAQT